MFCETLGAKTWHEAKQNKSKDLWALLGCESSVRRQITFPTNTPRVFPRRLNVQYTSCVCRVKSQSPYEFHVFILSTWGTDERPSWTWIHVKVFKAESTAWDSYVLTTRSYFPKTRHFSVGGCITQYCAEVG